MVKPLLQNFSTNKDDAMEEASYIDQNFQTHWWVCLSKFHSVIEKFEVFQNQ